MTTADALLSQSGAQIAIATCRIGGFVAISPFPGAWVQTTQKVGLVVVLSVVVALSLPPSDIAFDNHLIVAAPLEVLCGLMIGGMFRLAMTSVDVLGGSLSQATGLGVASVLNPQTEAQDTTTGRLVSLFGMSIALAVGAHRVALGYLLASYRALPVGSHFDVAGAVPTLAATFEASFAFGLRVSMPLLGAALVAQLALAVVARVAPAMQIFNTGLTVLAFAGLATFVASGSDIAGALANDLGDLDGRLGALFDALGGGGP